MTKQSENINRLPHLQKSPTGITGLDEITEGGLPRGRPTLVCGAAGSGKTLFAMEFVIRGVTEFGEPGVVMSFEETAEELATNVASLGFDVEELIRQGKMAIDYVRVERSEIEETGEYDLEGLFVRLNAMICAVGAKRVVLDTVEALFAGLPNEGILRAELRRLLRWLKDRGVTTVITGEQGERTLTRHGLEEYVSDCVIFLDHRVTDQIATRRLRIVKYRGSRHGTNEYPTLIDEHGLSVLPISSLGLDYPVSNERVSSGIRRLDAMLGGEGYYPRQQRPYLRHGGYRQDQPGRRVRRRRPAGGASGACTSPSRSHPSRSCATCAPSAFDLNPGSKRACSGSPVSGRRCTGWRCTWPTSTSWSRNFEPMVGDHGPDHEPDEHREIPTRSRPCLPG